MWDEPRRDNNQQGNQQPEQTVLSRFLLTMGMMILLLLFIF